jgi:hypothetical protein
MRLVQLKDLRGTRRGDPFISRRRRSSGRMGSIENSLGSEKELQMRPVLYLYISLLCGTLPTVAAAQQAQSAQATPAAQSSPTAKTPTPAASSPATPASSASPAHANSAQELTADEKKLVSRGYRLEVKNGQKTFCRREVVLGSHFEKKVCGTAEQLAAATQEGRDITNMTQLHGTNPVGN